MRKTRPGTTGGERALDIRVRPTTEAADSAATLHDPGLKPNLPEEEPHGAGGDYRWLPPIRSSRVTSGAGLLIVWTHFVHSPPAPRTTLHRLVRSAPSRLASARPCARDFGPIRSRRSSVRCYPAFLFGPTAFPLGIFGRERPLEGGGQRVKTRRAPRPHQALGMGGRSRPGRRAWCVPADRVAPGVTATTAKESRAMPL